MFCKLSCLVLINCFFYINFFANDMKFTTYIELKTPGRNNQEEKKRNDSFESATSKSFSVYSVCNDYLSDKLLQNNKKGEININKTVNNNNNNEQEKINEKIGKLLNNENMKHDDNNISEQKRNENMEQGGDLKNDLFNNEEEIKENNNPNIGKGQISD